MEQSYKQVKQALGWAQCQVRSDPAIRRHWRLVMCAFAFCWWSCAGLSGADAPLGVLPKGETSNVSATPELTRRGGKKGPEKPAPAVSWPAALRKVRAWLEPWVMLWRYWRAFSDKPPPAELRALLEQVFSGRGLYLYAH